MQAVTFSPATDGLSATPFAVRQREVLAQFRGAPQRFVDVGHSQLAYWRFGSGPDVLFVHGWPLNSSTFRGVIPRLSDRFTCHLFDLPGAGKTTCNDASKIDLEEHVETLGRAASLLGLERFAVIAHDSGGYVARVLAARDPRVTGLVLGNTEVPGHTPPIIQLYWALAHVPGAAALMRASLSSQVIRKSALGFGSCFERSSAIDGEFHELLVVPVLASPAAMQRQFTLLKNLNFTALARLSEVHAQIRVPVRLVWGSADTFFPLAKARAMLPEFGGGAELSEIAGGKLFVHDERPEAFSEHARSFLEHAVQVEERRREQQ
ncbi:MAG TPA: alpha/beta hydrolase [Polyangiaceae bacterium]|nr:alpha/beta hydrolase [Polyangiaceae bacterium]